LQKIPIIGLIAGAGFALHRYLQGDTVGAGLELASGAASTLPGLGTATSVAIDVGLAARDINKAMAKKGEGSSPATAAEDTAASAEPELMGQEKTDALMKQVQVYQDFRQQTERTMNVMREQDALASAIFENINKSGNVTQAKIINEEQISRSLAKQELLQQMIIKDLERIAAADDERDRKKLKQI
jgi:hypothetical protein